MKKEIYWSRFANDWESKINHVVGKRDLAKFKKVLSAQKPFGKALELGCGSGTYSGVLMLGAEHLSATDFSTEMVVAARRRLEGRGNVDVAKADCFNLPYRDSTFDTVFMGNLLHIVPEPEKALLEARRVLKADGRLIVISCTAEGMSRFNRFFMFRRFLKTFGPPPADAQSLCVGTTKEMLTKHAFRVERIELVGTRTKAVFACATALDGVFLAD